MTRETRVIVYSEGAFHDQPAPGWYREAEELEAGGLDWQKALSRVLGTDHDQYAELLGDVGIEIRVWRSTGLGTYVETETTSPSIPTNLATGPQTRSD